MSWDRGVGRERGRRENNVNIVLEYKILKKIKHTHTHNLTLRTGRSYERE